MNFEKKQFRVENITNRLLGQKGIYISYNALCRDIFINVNGKSAKFEIGGDIIKILYLEETQIFRQYELNAWKYTFVKINMDATLEITSFGSHNKNTIIFYSNQSRYNQYYLMEDEKSETPELLQIDLTQKKPKMTMLKGHPEDLHMPSLLLNQRNELSLITNKGFHSLDNRLSGGIIKCIKNQIVYYLRTYFILDNFEKMKYSNLDHASFYQIQLNDPKKGETKRILLELPSDSLVCFNYVVYGRFLYVGFTSIYSESIPTTFGNVISPEERSWIYAIDLLRIESEESNPEKPFGEFRKITQISDREVIVEKNHLVHYNRNIPQSEWKFLDKEMITINKSNVYSLDYFEVRKGRLGELPKQVRAEIITFWCCLQKREDLPGLPKDIRFYIVCFLI